MDVNSFLRLKQSLWFAAGKLSPDHSILVQMAVTDAVMAMGWLRLVGSLKS